MSPRPRAISYGTEGGGRGKECMECEKTCDFRSPQAANMLHRIGIPVQAPEARNFINVLYSRMCCLMKGTERWWERKGY